MALRMTLIMDSVALALGDAVTGSMNARQNTMLSCLDGKLIGWL